MLLQRWDVGNADFSTVTEWEMRVRDITGHYRDGPPGNHLHWYGQQQLTAKSIKPTQKKQNKITYYLHTHALKHNG